MQLAAKVAPDSERVEQRVADSEHEENCAGRSLVARERDPGEHERGAQTDRAGEQPLERVAIGQPARQRPLGRGAVRVVQ